MRVFVLNTGRCGSVTFARSCDHITNFTVAHEGNWNTPISKRFEYPDQHIEVDNRLSWFMGAIAQRYPDARYVHLYRDPEQVARSFLLRWRADPPTGPHRKNPINRVYRLVHHRHPGTGILPAFAYSLYGRSDRAWTHEERLDVCREYVRIVTSNIQEFLQYKEHMQFDIANAGGVAPQLWDWLGAEGDLAATISSFGTRHNASQAQSES